MSILPKFVVLRSNLNNRYLRYRHEEGTGQGYLQFSGEEAVSQYAKFEVERSSETATGLVHIRSCYSNMYWVRALGDRYIVAGSDKRNEDTSSTSCTLFEPVFEGSIVRFRHVNQRSMVHSWQTGGMLANSLFIPVAPQNTSTWTAMTAIDWEGLCILPKYVAFKGDNDQYLSLATLQGNFYQQFSSIDIGELRCHNEVFNTGDGHIRIKSISNDRFWRRLPSSELIWIDSLDTTNNNRDTLFNPIRVARNVIALRNVGYNWLCRRHTVNANTVDVLHASSSTITNPTRLVVEETVLSRIINTVDFRLSHARIYNETIRTMATGQATNCSPDPTTVELRLDYTQTTSRTWNSNVSLTLGVESTITAGIPSIIEASISVSSSVTSGHEWGETHEISEAVGTTYTVVVPPMSRVIVSLLATEGTCDVPFSYIQRDTHYNGFAVTERKDDGVYTGINSYNFHYENRPLRLTAAEVGEEIAKQEVLAMTTPAGADVTTQATDPHVE